MLYAGFKYTWIFRAKDLGVRVWGVGFRGAVWVSGLVA